MFWWNDLKQDIPDYILFLSGIAFLVGYFFIDPWLSYVSAGTFVLTLLFKIDRDHRRAEERREWLRNYVPPPPPKIGMTEYEVDQSDWGRVYILTEEITEFETIRYQYYEFKGQLTFTNGYLTKITKYR